MGGFNSTLSGANIPRNNTMRNNTMRKPMNILNNNMMNIPKAEEMMIKNVETVENVGNYNRNRTRKNMNRNVVAMDEEIIEEPPNISQMGGRRRHRSHKRRVHKKRTHRTKRR